MAITIKRTNKLTLKTQAAKPVIGTSADKATAGTGTPDEQASPSPSPSPSPVAQAPAMPVQIQTTAGISHTPAVICAIVALILFLALLGLQWAEWSYYQQPRCAWPSIAMPTMSAPSTIPSTPVAEVATPVEADANASTNNPK